MRRPLVWMVGFLVGSLAPLSAQTRVLSGRVSYSLSGEMVTSGQVSVQGTTLGATIKSDGTFTLAVPTRDVTLIVRSIGFKSRTIPVPSSEGAVTVTLDRDYFQLEAIVVTVSPSARARKAPSP